MRFPVWPSRRAAVAAIAGYLAVAVALTVAWLVLGARSAERTGLVRHIYPGPAIEGVPLRQDVASDVTLGFLDADPTLRRRFFAARWQGFWYVPEAGVIRLLGAGDDRLDVWLGGEHVISRRPPADMHTIGREVTLDAGAHRIDVRYVQRGGDYNLRLEWQPIGGRARSLAAHRLFREEPTPADVRRSRQVRRLRWFVFSIWFAPLLVAGSLPAIGCRTVLRRYGPASELAPYWSAVLRGAVLAAVAAVTVRALFARLPGLNPGSLWYDDLVYAAVIRTDDLWSLVTAPLQAPPGLLVVWRAFYELFPDPEWSLQLLPFVCGVAAIPAMAAAVRAATGDDGLAALAAGLTALNQFLAHYTVYVRQYAVEFLLTALFLLAAARLSRDPAAIDPRRFGRVALCGGLAAFFSVTSVFISFPVVNLGAAYAACAWFRDRGRARAMLGIAGAYDAAVFVAWLLLRNRSNPHSRDYFADGFMPIDSLAAMSGFLADKGRYLLETSLPGWGTGWNLNPGTVSWPLPFLLLGLAWLLAQRSTRLVGMAILCFYAERVVASALWIYPLGMGRTDVFALPAAIVLFAAGIQAATAALPRPGRFRLAVAAVVVAFALFRPVGAWYFDTDDVPLVEHLAARIGEDDALILSESGIFLTAFYGPWAVDSTAATDVTYGVGVTLMRDGTLHLPRSGSQPRTVGRFVGASLPPRVWYVAHNTQGWEDDIVAAIENQGYAVHRVQETTNGRLYRGVREAPYRGIEAGVRSGSRTGAGQHPFGSQLPSSSGTVTSRQPCEIEPSNMRGAPVPWSPCRVGSSVRHRRGAGRSRGSAASGTTLGR